MAKSIALVAIMKGESSYIAEWVAYHLIIGFDHIYIYDNDSESCISDAIRSLDQVSIIRWHTEEGISPQLSAYEHARKSIKDQYAYVAFFDADEFLCMTGSMSLVNWLNNLPEDVGAIAINQHVFGSSGHAKRESGLVVQRFQLACMPAHDECRWVKSIYRLPRVNFISSCHRGEVGPYRYISPDGSDAFDGKDAYTDLNGLPQQTAKVDFSVMKLNHYMLKSREEFEAKKLRGGASAPTLTERISRTNDDLYFDYRDTYCNLYFDDVASKLTLEVIDRIALQGLIDV